jgi:ABC-type multidrug transport system ATPase subunit
MIVANHLTKRYAKTTALNDISFHIEGGESVALWGENGAGKTTAIRCLLGVQGFEGELTVNGLSVRKAGKAARAVIGYVPQETKFYDLSILETLRFYARLKKVIPTRISPVLDQVQLTQHQHKRVSMLSGGMKQRLALAVALLADPPILILDEPTANLDVGAQRDFIRTIQTLNGAGKTVIFSSHRLDEVLALATRVLVLANGKLSFECLPHELAEKLGLHRWLRIWVNPAHHTAMLRVFDEQGFNYKMNSHSVFVPVAGNQKSVPLWTLQQANIPIEDFDFVSDESLVGQEGNHG